MPRKSSAGIRALVVDDESLARSNLTVLLRRDSDIESVEECASGAQAVQEIRSTQPDLVFLDVQMPECGGFDVLELLKGDVLPVIVFVTAYDEYALRAFEVGALDYLLKPFDDPRFDLAMLRTKQKIAQRRALAPPDTRRLIIKRPGQVLFVQMAAIDWIEAADYYSCLHVGAKTHLLRRTMTELERELDPEVFCRIHRSTIVNLHRVRGLELNGAGEHEVILESGERLRLSRTFRKDLQARIGTRRLTP